MRQQKSNRGHWVFVPCQCKGAHQHDDRRRKITLAQARAIQRARAKGVNAVELAAKYGITRSAVYAIQWGQRSGLPPVKPPKRGPQRGERHGNAKLTDARVRRIRQLRAAGKTCKVIAEKYGLAISTVSDVTRGRCWRHVR